MAAVSDFRAPVAQWTEQRSSKADRTNELFVHSLSTNTSDQNSVTRCSLSYLRWAQTVRRKSATMQIHERSVRSLVSVIGDLSVDQVTKEHVREWIVARSNQVAASTVKIEFGSLRAFFNWLVDEEEIRRSPCERIRLPAEKESPPPVYSNDDISALLSACKQIRSKAEGIRNSAIILCLLDCGMRRSEIANVQVADLDLNTRVMLLRVTKTGTPRVVPIGDRTTLALDKYLRIRAKHRLSYLPDLWIGQHGPLTASGIGQLLKELGIRAGVLGVRPHRFRHTFAHRASAAGMQMPDLMAIAGWKSVSMVVRYGKSAAAERAIAAHRRFSPVDNLGE